MRKFYLLLLFLCIKSCDYPINKENIIEETENEYPNNFVKWEDIFSKDEQDYFIYVFSYDCFYCKETKNKIIELYDYGIFPVYFCEYLKQIPIGHNTLNTVGKSKIDDIFIRGTPSLIYISENKVVFNVAGRSEVLDMIDLYLKIE